MGYAGEMRAPVDFGRTSEDYARWRARFPERLFAELRARGIGLAGQRALDVATGTGFLAQGLAAEGARVLGVDLSPAQVAAARALAAREAPGARLAFAVGRAEALPLADGALDVACAAQCWHWLEPRAAARELARVLAPGGRAVLTSFDWLGVGDPLVAATEALVREHNPAWALHGGDGLHPEYARDLAQAGLAVDQTLCFDVDVAYSHAGWRGRIRASSGVGASLSPAAAEAFDAAHARLLAERFPDPLAVPHRSYTVLARRA